MATKVRSEKAKEAHNLRERNRRAAERERAKNDPVFAAELAQKNRHRNRKRTAARKENRERSELPNWKKSKPGRIVALCGWIGW